MKIHQNPMNLILRIKIVFYRITPSRLVICATIGATVIAMLDALSKIFLAEERLSEIIFFLGLANLVDFQL